MVGAVTDGDSIPDLSGNSLNGEMVYEPLFTVYPNDQPYGYASPIETDAASREFYGWTNANAEGYPGTSRIKRASHSLLRPSGDAACEAWIRPMGGMYAAVDIRLVGTPDFGIQWSFDGYQRFAAYCYDTAGTQWKAIDTTIDFRDYLGESFHLVAVRTGNSLSIYRNGYLKTTTTITSGLATRQTVGEFFVHRNTNLTYAQARYDESAFYNHSLTGTRVLVHYEAAKAVLPLRATITVQVNVELNTDQIVPTNLGFGHNFSDTFGDSQIPIVEEISYKTNVNQSEPDYQQRVGARPHGAYRSLEYHLSPSSGAGRARLQGALYAPAQNYCLPVWSDSGVTTGAANSGTSTIPVDTTKRDYEVGSYCGTATDIQDPSTYQFFKITVVADAQLTLETNIATTIPSGSTVFPARLASISDDSLSVKSFAADHEDSIIRFDVLETELSTRRIATYTPATTYKSIEVFSLESAKVSFLDSRPYDISRRIQVRGRDYQYAVDTGSPQTFPVRFLLTTRSALSDFYGWLDARQGKLNPLFVSTKEKDYIATARPTSQTLTVTKAGFSLHHGRRDLEILKTDGTFSRVRLTAITDNGSTETLTTSASFPVLGDISKISFLKYCVLGSDSISIRHYKGGSSGAIVSECAPNFRELLTSPV